MPLIFFAASKPTGAPPFFRRLHRLAADDPGGGARLAPVAFAARFKQRMMDAVERAVAAPLPEGGVDGRARREVLGRRAPLAPRREHVEDRVHDLAHSARGRQSMAAG